MIAAIVFSAGPVGDRPAELVALVGLLALAPAALVMLTSFLKISVVLSIARSALGAPQVPPSTAVTGLALGLSLLVMAPVAEGLSLPDQLPSDLALYLDEVERAILLRALEQHRFFTIGFVVFLPFLAVDLVVANVLLALGLTQLSPTSVALPFKLLLFVAVDGWRLLARALALSYAA